jgi:predicted HicB family RNase H-like nuclease
MTSGVTPAAALAGKSLNSYIAESVERRVFAG